MDDCIGIIGTGKLGLCFALASAGVGFKVIATDTNRPYLESIGDRSLRSKEPGVNELLGRNPPILIAPDVAGVASKCTILFIFVPTPSLPGGGYDHSAIDDVLEKIPQRLEIMDAVVCCTTMPGYVESVSAEAAARGYRLSYNPEFIAQGRIIDGIVSPDMVLIGEYNRDAGDRIQGVYERMCPNRTPIFRMSPTAAETTKIALNCFLTMKISFANAIGDLLLRLGCTDEVDVSLACIGADQRIGAKFLRFGDGYGGPCLPRDNAALGLAGSKAGLKMRLSEASDAQNRIHLFEQLSRVLSSPGGIVISDVAYKKGTDMIEESQRLALAVEAAKSGRVVMIRDTEEVIAQVRTIHGDLFSYEVVS